MAFIPVANTAMIEFKFLYGAEIIENTIWMENSINPTGGMLDDLCEAAAAAWGSNLSVHQSVGIALFEVKATSMTSDTSPTGSYFPTPPIDGEIATPPLPSSVTWSIQFRTSLRGRSYRGRNYWIGLGESQVSGNGITSTLAGQIVTGYEDMINEISTDGWSHVVVSRFSGGAPRVAGVTTPVTSYGYADLWVDNQRRRLTGRGS